MQRKYIGRILAVVGLVLLLSSTLTWFIGAHTMALTKVTIALILFGIYAATNFGDLGESASSRGAFFYGVSAIGTLLLVGVLAAINFIAAKNPKSWDLTKNQIHTLSSDTVKTLEGLKDDLTVTAFYRPGEPELETFTSLADKYKAKSDHIKVEILDPAKEPMRVKDLNIQSSGPRVLVTLGKTEGRVQELTEEELTNAIVKVTHSSVKKIYFTAGHGESDLDDTSPTGLSEVKKRMENEGLKAEKLNVAGATEIPEDAQAIVIAGPAKAFQPGETEGLKKFLDAGGRAMVMVEPLAQSGLEEFLKDYNVEADNALIVDPISRVFGASEAMPVVQTYSETSEITRDFRLNTAFPTARPLTILHEKRSTATVDELATSMPTAWGETNPTGKVEHNDNERSGPFPLVVAATEDTKSAQPKRTDQLRMVVAGDRDFATNQYRNFVGNEDFFLNCLNWLSGQTERITIRPRTRDASRLYLTETQKASIFFLGIDILPVTLLAIGLSVWSVRRSK
jgi:ABC-type uncharacterized transport system involved in gliding motility auxiliary subunit